MVAQIDPRYTSPSPIEDEHKIAEKSNTNVLKQLEDFYYRSRWGRINLGGPPKNPMEYRRFTDIQLHENLLTVRADTDEKIIEDVWEIVWQNGPSLKYLRRVGVDLPVPVQSPAKTTEFEGARLTVEPRAHEACTTVTILRPNQEPFMKRLDYGIPTYVTMNKKWSAVACGRVISVFGKDEYKNYEEHVSAKNPILYMHLDDDDGLFTLSDGGLAELWALPNTLKRTPTISHFNQAQLFKAPQERNILGRFIQAKGTFTRDGDLCFIAKEEFGVGIHIHMAKPYKPYQRQQPDVNQVRIEQLEQELIKMRSLAFEAQAEKWQLLQEAQKQAQASNAEKQQLAEQARASNAEKQRLETIQADEKRKATRLVEQIQIELRSLDSTLKLRTAELGCKVNDLTNAQNELRNQAHLHHESLEAARMREESAHSAVARLNIVLQQTKAELDQTKELLQSAAAKAGMDPVSYEPLKEPVALACGHLFNQSTINEMRRQGNQVCPCCRAPHAPLTDRRIIIERQS